MSGPRVVVIGTAAHIFPTHKSGLTEIGAQIVGVHDVNAERLELVAEELGCPAYHALADLLIVPADLAVMVWPHPFHAELGIAALQAGPDVLAVALQHWTRTEVEEARRLIESGPSGGRSG